MTDRISIFITAGEQPKRLNELRRANWQQREETKRWREAAYLTAIAQQTEKVTRYPVTVIATPYLETKRLQDVGASYFAVKAAIDGLVDAGVLVDDDPKHLVQLCQRAPLIGQPQGGLLIEIEQPANPAFDPRNVDPDRLREFYERLDFDIVGRHGR